MRQQNTGRVEEVGLTLHDGKRVVHDSSLVWRSLSGENTSDFDGLIYSTSIQQVSKHVNRCAVM